MKLGILDQMPQPKGRTAEETAAHTIDMAQKAESLGYERYWFAEHHATRGMTSSAPGGHDGCGGEPDEQN